MAKTEGTMPRYRWGAPLALIAISLGLSACDSITGVFNQPKQAPDEFQVVAQQPLSIPPNADLRPPRPGAPRPQDTPAQVQARSIVTGGPVPPPGTNTQVASTSDAESAFLKKAGYGSADPDIRSKVNRETRIIADNDRSFIDELIFWRKPEPQGVVVDPAKEQQRIRETQAVGEPITKGDTPTIERRQRGLLEGIF